MISYVIDTTCGATAKDAWLARRMDVLLPCNHKHATHPGQDDGEGYERDRGEAHHPNGYAWHGTRQGFQCRVIRSVHNAWERCVCDSSSASVCCGALWQDSEWPSHPLTPDRQEDERAASTPVEGHKHRPVLWLCWQQEVRLHCIPARPLLLCDPLVRVRCHPWRLIRWWRCRAIPTPGAGMVPPSQRVWAHTLQQAGWLCMHVSGWRGC